MSTGITVLQDELTLLMPIGAGTVLYPVAKASWFYPVPKPSEL